MLDPQVEITMLKAQIMMMQETQSTNDLLIRALQSQLIHKDEEIAELVNRIYELEQRWTYVG